MRVVLKQSASIPGPGRKGTCALEAGFCSRRICVSESFQDEGLSFGPIYEGRCRKSAFLETVTQNSSWSIVERYKTP